MHDCVNVQDMKLWLDADAAPRDVKDVCIRASERLALETVLVVHNLGGAQVKAGPFAEPGTKAVSLFSDSSASVADGSSGWTATLGPHASGAWRLQ